MSHLDQVMSQRLGCGRTAKWNGFAENLGLHKLERGDQVFKGKDRNTQYRDKLVLLSNMFSCMVLTPPFRKNSG